MSTIKNPLAGRVESLLDLERFLAAKNAELEQENARLNGLLDRALAMLGYPTSDADLVDIERRAGVHEAQYHYLPYQPDACHDCGPTY